MIHLITNKKSPVFLSLLLGLGVASNSQALTYSFDIDTPRQNAAAGYIDNISTQYSSDTSTLTWASTTSIRKGKLSNGFWLVLSDGANPKSHYNEYSIFYGDLKTGNLTSYVYNGYNSSNSWKKGEFIQMFEGVINSDYSEKGKVSYDFSIDVTSLNSYIPTSKGKNDWDGAQFDKGIGVWYHPFVSRGKGFSYNKDGSLASLRYGKSGWYDTGGQNTTVVDVPEPGTLALASLGLVGMFASSRRRKTKA